MSAKLIASQQVQYPKICLLQKLQNYKWCCKHHVVTSQHIHLGEVTC